ncbi:MAG TPA: UDP-N-acetylmuramoyl-tripeptide--D-alanyl-D-alanine ligase [Clostridiales bacterium]|nr:UDP-N-acetylmuramoyl-tripeptide--D-alanyl-D-alanine ligase [Clostridiales bacterium]
MIGLKISEIMEATQGKLQGGDSSVLVGDISTDSRKINPGSLFIALKGERFDGNDFLTEAFANGAVAVMTDREAADFPGRIVIKVEDTLKALHDLALYYRDRFDIPFVGITGSVGKTSTKDMVACALGARYNVLKNEGNLNNEIGVPLTIFRLEPGHEAAVIEMGMSGFGEIRALTRIVKPKVGIITNIGLSHIEKLGSRQDILRAKLELIEGLQPDGVLILNGDDVMLNGVKDLLEVRTVSYGLEEDVDYQAYNIRSKGEKGTDFNIKLDGNEYNVHVPAPGVHNVYNALAALAAGHELGVPADLLISGIAGHTPGSMRLNILKSNGLTVINDAYNASPQSVKAAIDVLNEIEAERRIAVLGDMLELGSWSTVAHKETGAYVAGSRTDMIITVGQAAAHIAEGAMEAGFPGSGIVVLANNGEAIRYLQDIIREGDAILVKGSRGMMMEEIVNSLISG